MSLLPSGAIETGGYDINNSIRFRRSASAYLTKTPASAGNQKTYTISFWYKRGLLTSQQGLFEGYVNSGTLTSFNINNDTFSFQIYSSPSYNVVWATTAVFRDPSSWYHVVLTIDTTQASQANMAKLYVNGIQQTFSYTNYLGSIAQNTNTNINASGTSQYIGVYVYNGSFQDGYFAEYYLIDGQALTPSSFGETDAVTGSWVAKKYTGTYGTNGFYLKFSDIATTSGSNAGLGKDFSGNGNYWTTNNISVTAGTTYDAMTDSPTLTSATVANYAVMNPLQKQSGVTLSNANLNVQTSGSSGSGTVNATFGVSSGKWYWETTLNAATDATIFGIDEITELPSYPGSTSTSYSYYPVSALKINNTIQTSYGVTATTNDVIGCALDMDNGKIWWSKNGTWMASGDPTAGTNAAFTGITGTKTPAVGDGSSSSNVNVEYNFGQRPFAYTPPTGFVALNTYNLPTPTILQGNKYMDATVYTGDGTSPKSQTNAAGFKPDFVWIKNRSNAYWHQLYDSVRGAGSSKNLQSNTTNAEGNSASLYGYLSAFNSNGFQTTNGTDPSSPSIWVNTSGQTFVGWQWQAGQGTTSSGTGTGGITSVTQSVNATAGFSIVTFTASGANGTFTHGLGVAPKMFIIKARNVVASWGVWHDSLTTPSTALLLLDSTGAQTNNATYWNSTVPTSSTVSIGTAWSAGNYVAYCWAEIAGFSKFGSYTGNGSTDGPMIFTGFNPKYWLVKRTDSADDWFLFDSARDPYNIIDLRLSPNASYAEASTTTGFDFLANGVKVRSSSTAFNASGGTYIYMAFAENPFKNSLAR